MFDPNRDYGPDPEDSPFDGTGELKPEYVEQQAAQQQKEWEATQYPDPNDAPEPDDAA